jgi:hypothetical protein
MEEELNLDCECHAEIVKIIHYKEESEFGLVVFRYAPESLSLVDRIKFIFGGHIATDVILSERSAFKMADFITNHINNVKE